MPKGPIRILAMSLLFFTLLTLGGGAYGFWSSLQGMVRDYAHYHTASATRLLMQQSWYPYNDAIIRVLIDKKTDWKSDPEFRAFLANTANWLEAFNGLQVNFYSPTQQLFFQDKNASIAYEKPWYWAIFPDKAESIKIFRQGGFHNLNAISYTYWHEASYLSADGKAMRIPMIQSIVPIMVTDREGVSRNAGYVEIFEDASMLYRQSIEMIRTMVLSVLSMIALLGTMLTLSSRKMTVLLSKQVELNHALEEARAKAEEESQQKSKFLANVSHELRTPLNAIIGFSEMMREERLGPLGNEKYLEYANDVHTSGTHLLTLINDILDYSKAEAEKLTIEKKPVNLSKIAQSSLRLVQSRADEAKVTLEAVVPNPNVIVNGDPKRLKQVLLNLLSNAVKFTPEKGTVTVEVKTVDTNAHLVVRDTGIGIAAKDIAKAMATFGQVDNALSRKYEGTGLGLPLTQKLVQLMGGNFDIMSEPNMGTTVTCVFAINDQAFEATENNTSGAPADSLPTNEAIPAVVQSAPAALPPIAPGAAPIAALQLTPLPPQASAVPAALAPVTAPAIMPAASSMAGSPPSPAAAAISPLAAVPAAAPVPSLKADPATPAPQSDSTDNIDLTLYEGADVMRPDDAPAPRKPANVPSVGGGAPLPAPFSASLGAKGEAIPPLSMDDDLLMEGSMLSAVLDTPVMAAPPAATTPSPASASPSSAVSDASPAPAVAPEPVATETAPAAPAALSGDVKAISPAAIDLTAPSSATSSVAKPLSPTIDLGAAPSTSEPRPEADVSLTDIVKEAQLKLAAKNATKPP